MSESAGNTISRTGMHRIPVRTAAPNTAEQSGKPTPADGKILPVESEQMDIEAVVEKLNLATQSIGRDLRFEVNLDSGHSVIQVLDRETGEIIRQIPPEKVSPTRAENGALTVRLYDDVV
ncbi:MAG: flagellar protein FlaG [Woeseia sp.]